MVWCRWWCKSKLFVTSPPCQPATHSSCRRQAVRASRPLPLYAGGHGPPSSAPKGQTPQVSLRLQRNMARLNGSLEKDEETNQAAWEAAKGSLVGATKVRWRSYFGMDEFVFSILGNAWQRGARLRGRLLTCWRTVGCAFCHRWRHSLCLLALLSRSDGAIQNVGHAASGLISLRFIPLTSW